MGWEEGRVCRVGGLVGWAGGMRGGVGRWVAGGWGGGHPSIIPRTRAHVCTRRLPMQENPARASPQKHHPKAELGINQSGTA